VSIHPQADRSYQYGTSSTLFAKGDILGVSSTGGSVPPFAKQTVVGPGLVVFTSSAIADEAGVDDAGVPLGTRSVSTSRDLTVNWTGGESGRTVVVSVNAGVDSGSINIQCVVDATLGAATVPPSALNGMASLLGSVTVEQVNTMAFNAGMWLVAVQAINGDGFNATFVP
jgi:hypothetical protein